MALTVAPDFTDGILTASKLQQLSDAINERTPLNAIKSADESLTSDTALQNDNELTLSLAANAVYGFLMLIRYDATAASDFKTQLVLPASATAFYNADGVPTAGTAFSLFNATEATVFAFEGAGAGTIRNVNFAGHITTVGTAGSAVLQWAQNVSGGTATIVKAGSRFTAWRMS